MLRGSMNRLKVWRKRTRLSAVQVDQRLKFAPGKTCLYERMRFTRIPCCELVKMAKLYRVPELEFIEVIDLEVRELRR